MFPQPLGLWGKCLLYLKFVVIQSLLRETASPAHLTKGTIKFCCFKISILQQQQSRSRMRTGGKQARWVNVWHSKGLKGEGRILAHGKSRTKSRKAWYNCKWEQHALSGGGLKGISFISGAIKSLECYGWIQWRQKEASADPSPESSKWLLQNLDINRYIITKWSMYILLAVSALKLCIQQMVIHKGCVKPSSLWQE